MRGVYAFAFAILAISALASGHTCGVPMVQIELDALSGRPNPTWQLDDTQARELLALLVDLPSTAPRKPGGLGYRGFLVYRPAAGGAVPAPIRVFAGTIEIDSTPHVDLHGAETWLLRSARANGWAAIADTVPPR